jgi:alkanesulfonate monooxygenase SsuD/methylene tetrahydromethanopterin reductase-like flavin-dependent oxidoreductase (luciferase family)
VDIGIGLPTNLRNVDPDNVLNWAQRAEQAGFSTLGMGERLTYDGYDWCVSLTAAAAVTSRVKLMSNVVILPIHPVGVLAKQTLSLDSFSKGRFRLGVGIGAPVYDYDVAPSPRERRTARFEEDIDALRRLWRGENAFPELRPIGPPATTEGGPEILIGALGPKSLRRVGRVGDGVITWSFAANPSEVRAMFDVVEAAWNEFGRSGSPKLLAGCYYAVGPTAGDDLTAYFNDYYPAIYDGPVAELVSTVTTATDRGVKDAVGRFEDIGCNEFIFQPIKASIDQAERLAELVFR